MTDATATGEPANPVTAAIPAPTSPAAAPANGKPARDTSTVEERAAAAVAALVASGEVTPEGNAPETAPPVVDEQAARDARIAAIKEREKARVAKERERQAARRPAPAAAHAAPAPPANATPTQQAAHAQVALDRLKTPEGLMSLAEEHGIAPEAFGEVLRNALANPDAVLTRRAKEMMSTVEIAAQKRIDALEARINGYEQQAQQAQSVAHESAVANAMVSFAVEHATQAPLASAWLRERGQDEFLALANGLSDRLPPGVGAQGVLDTVEDYLQGIARTLTGSTSARTPPASGRRPPPATTSPSNRAATDREAAIDEGAEWAKLTVEERGAVLKKRYA